MRSFFAAVLAAFALAGGASLPADASAGANARGTAAVHERAASPYLHLARAALAPKGRVAIVEWLPNEDRVSPPMPALFTMTMLLTTPSGTTYTGPEFSAMLTEAKFERPEIIPLVPTPLTLVLARPA